MSTNKSTNKSDHFFSLLLLANFTTLYCDKWLSADGINQIDYFICAHQHFFFSAGKFSICCPGNWVKYRTAMDDQCIPTGGIIQQITLDNTALEIELSNQPNQDTDE